MAFSRKREKLKKLVHYVVSQCEPESLGAIKLNKVLWVADLNQYAATGTPLTGEVYVKQQMGPVAGSLVGILSELQSEKKLVVRRRLAYGNPKVDYIALSEPENLSATFTADEISVVHRAMEFVCAQTAHEISERTHDIIWQLAEIGEEIPYEAMYASRLDGVTKDDVKWAKGAHARAIA